MKTKNKLLKLIDGSLESYYWLGLLFADGHFYENGRIFLSQSTKDMHQVYKFRNFIGHGNVVCRQVTTNFGKTDVWSWSVMDKRTSLILKEKFNIHNNKTKNPVLLDSLTDEQILCVMLGFTDGDGNIKFQTGRTDCILQIKCHANWKNNLEKLYKKKSFINNEGYVQLSISDNEILRDWKRFAIKNNLPINERKWGIIDENRESRYVNSKRVKENVMFLKNLKMKNSDIAHQLDISGPYVTKILKEINEY